MQKKPENTVDTSLINPKLLSLGNLDGIFNNSKEPCFNIVTAGYVSYILWFYHLLIIA